MFFLPLSFTFWRGIIWIPEMRGKGVFKTVSLLVFFCLKFYFIGLLQNCSKLLYFLVSILGSFLGFLEFFGYILWASLGLLNLFLCVALRAKKCRMSHAKMTFLKRMFFFGVFELLMVFMGSSRLLLGRSSVRMDFTMSLNISSDGSQQNVNFDYKTCNSGQQKCRQYLFKMRSPP